MRKIVAGLFVSVDGVVEAPETWTGPYFSPEIGQHIGSMMAAGDTMLLGRATYQTFAASFAGNTSDPMAAQMNATPKVVVSTTLAGATAMAGRPGSSSPIPRRTPPAWCA
jgi:hypothetical protein